MTRMLVVGALLLFGIMGDRRDAATVVEHQVKEDLNGSGIHT